MKSILTVCIGNICRSPLAAGLIARELPEILVSSAGVGALIGQPADSTAQQLSRENGIDISLHRARQINQRICSEADLILVMDLDQRRYVERSFPSVRGKVFRLLESEEIDIPDPYRQDIEVFRRVYDLIDQGSQIWTSRIKQINQKNGT